MSLSRRWDKYVSHLFIFITVNCVWEEWEAWGSCTTTCGDGTQPRSRNKATEDQHGGTECEGESSEEQACPNNPNCPSKSVILMFDQ